MCDLAQQTSTNIVPFLTPLSYVDLVVAIAKNAVYFHRNE